MVQWITSISISLPLHLQYSSKLRPRDHPCPANPSVSASLNPRRRCSLYDMHNELVPYADAWSWQKAIVKEKKVLNEEDRDFKDSLIVLQHCPVYTLGTGGSEEFLNFDKESAPFDFYRTERGGEVTYHGPGQLVMYPIINLRYYEMDLHWYLRALEEVVIRALFMKFGIEASRTEGLTGVWVGVQLLDTTFLVGHTVSKLHYSMKDHNALLCAVFDKCKCSAPLKPEWLNMKVVECVNVWQTCE